MVRIPTAPPTPADAMRQLALATLLSSLALAAGCGKKASPPEPEEQPAARQAAQPDPAAERNKLLAGLKSSKQESRRYSVEELSWLAEDDPAVLPALVEVLKDKGTAGSGRTRADQVTSTREAAAMAIMLCTGGEKVMREKGLPVLREGLTDPSPAVREHTAYTLGLLGALAKPLAADLQKLCTDPDANVRGAAFDALRMTGLADPVALAKLLTHKDEEVARLAAELVPLVKEVPPEAVPPLTEALASESVRVRTAAAEGLAAAGPKAAPAVQQLADAIKKGYPAEPDPEAAQIDGPEAAYWAALARIGAPAVAPTAKLLEHSNFVVRMLAARTLAEIGEPARPAKDALVKALGDQTINVAVEAAVALCALGESIQASLDLMKRGIDAPNDAVAAYAVAAVPRLGARGKELVPPALAKMGDANPNTRYAAVGLVAELPPEEAKKAAADVGKRATDELPEIRRLAGRVLERLGPTGAPAAASLGEALAKETELDIRDQFVEALVAMKEGAKPAVPGMLPLVADKSLDATVRAKVAAALVVADPASPQVSSALVKAAADPDPTLRAAAATALGQVNPLPAEALAAVVKLAKADARTTVRSAAVRALATAGPRTKAAKPDLEAVAGGKMAGLALWAKVALAAIDGDVQKAAPTVRAGLTDRSSSTRAAAAEALLVIGPTTADLPVLLKLLRDANSTTKAAAARNVAKLGPAAKDAVPSLVRLLDDRESETRIAAAEALGAIGPASAPAVRKLKELRNEPLAKATAQRAIEKIEKK
jgi:HEAT repeat protein